MALINCYECNKEISDKAKSCPHCGAPKIIKKISNDKSDERDVERVKKTFEVSQEISKKSGKLFWILIGLCLMTVAYYQIKILIPKSSSNNREVIGVEARKNFKVNSEIESKSSNESKKPKVSKWYEDGDLHKSYVTEWRNASYKNKLATCADWMAVLDNKISMSLLKKRAEQLVICIDETVATDARGQKISGTLKTTDLAVSCIQILF